MIKSVETDKAGFQMDFILTEMRVKEASQAMAFKLPAKWSNIRLDEKIKW